MGISIFGHSYFVTALVVLLQAIESDDSDYPDRCVRRMTKATFDPKSSDSSDFYIHWVSTIQPVWTLSLYTEYELIGTCLH